MGDGGLEWDKQTVCSAATVSRLYLYHYFKLKLMKTSCKTQVSLLLKISHDEMRNCVKNYANLLKAGKICAKIVLLMLVKRKT